MINLTMTAFESGVYYCKDGDTLESIAKKFSTSKELIIKENSLKGEVCSGDCLLVVRYQKVYTVGIEDTAITVAEKLGVSVEELLKTNKITDIYPYMQVVCDEY